MGRFGYLSVVVSSLGFRGIGIGDILLCDSDDHAPWMIVGHLVGE